MNKHREMGEMPGKMQESLSIRLSKLYLDVMDHLIENGIYHSKSEIIREALRLFYDKQGVQLLTFHKDKKED